MRIALLLVASLASAQTVADLHRAFENPPDDARIMMRWWWFGTAVTKPELEREMRAMRDGGIGGFEVQRFQAQDMQAVTPQPSGLLRQVRIIAR